MSSKTYRDCRKNNLLGPIRKTCFLEMKSAGEMEKKIAIKKGNVTKDGVPFITEFWLMEVG